MKSLAFSCGYAFAYIIGFGWIDEIMGDVFERAFLILFILALGRIFWYLARIET